MIASRALAIAICIGATVLLAWGAIARHPPGPEALPWGCDDFGYLNMAQAMDEGVWLADHAHRPFHADLVAHLEAQGAPLRSYAWMVAPHAYHVDERTRRVINQYPPGTSLMLNVLPLELRKLLAPGLWALLCMLPLAFAFQAAGPRSPLLGAAWALVAGAGLVLLPPTAGILGGTNSFAPTFGALVAAGWLLRSHPAAALALVSATVPIRIGNALLLAPIFLVLLFASERPLAWPALLRRGVRGGLAALGGGFFLYPLYATALLGVPWEFTYSPIDHAWADADALRANLARYLDLGNGWLRLHLVALLALAALARREGSARWVGAGLLIAGVNYVFFLLHHAATDWYTYASALLLVGMALRGLADAGLPGPRLLAAVAAAGVALVAADLRPIDFDGARRAFEQERELYREAFGEFDVVWGEERTGTVEYATRVAAFRYLWGPPAIRREVMEWLRARGFRQAVWSGDVNMPEGIAAELEGQGIGVRASRHPSLGEILILEPEG